MCAPGRLEGGFGEKLLLQAKNSLNNFKEDY
jgi:hypothetical protein